MAVQIISTQHDKLVFKVEIPLNGNIGVVEDKIQKHCNELGNTATEHLLKSLDTDGSPIIVGNKSFSSKGTTQKMYHTPYGDVSIERHVYQSSQGGKLYCPLDANGRILSGATPKYAKMLSSKYANMSAPDVIQDLQGNHNRKERLAYLQKVAETVGNIAEEKKDLWSYNLPDFKGSVHSIGISMDGAMLLMKDEGYRETMVGSISFYDPEGKRLHTIYKAAPPEYGKSVFKSEFEKEIQKVKVRYPDAIYVGLADGAKDNWTFLSDYTKIQVIDFYHASEYISKAGEGIFNNKRSKDKREEWIKETCHNLKNNDGAATEVLTQFENLLCDGKKRSKSAVDKINSAVTYFKNNFPRMNYSDNVEEKLPIGSGVIEAACKTIVKQRLCNSGMRWKEDGTRTVLNLRTLLKTDKRWEQFWNKFIMYGSSNI
jgi:hypothetical protein